MKADYVHKDTLTATDYVELNKSNELLMSYNQALLKENHELNKQLEDANEKIILLQASGPMLEWKKALEKNQQKEFIKYLEDYLKLFDKMNIDEQIIYDTIEEILSKFKEIIGSDINVGSIGGKYER